MAEVSQKTIRNKLILIITGITFTALLISSTIQLFAGYISTLQDADTRLEIIAKQTARNMKNALAVSDSNAAYADLSALGLEHSVVKACVYDASNHMFATYISSAPNSFLAERHQYESCPALADAIRAEDNLWSVHALKPIHNGNQKIGTLFLDYSLHNENSAFLRRLFNTLIVAMCSLILAVFLARYLQGFITKPILDLSSFASQIAEDKNYSLRAAKTTRDEIGVLVDSFNHMIDAIEKRDYEIVKARKEADKANAMKSDFLATMSHEIRTPMNGVLGMAELIFSARPSLQIETYTKTIINSGETLLQIIDDILDFSKIEAGKLVIDPMPINLMDIADDVAKLYAVKARDKAIELVVRHVPGSEQFVFADPVRLRQILGNLMSNAIKFTDEGHVVLTVEELKNISTPEKAVLKFSVTDTGIGLTKEEIGRIFEKFSQADNSTTRRYGGTGLGLSICKSLTEMMGGEINVTSNEAQGSTFWLTIPFKRNKDVVRDAPEHDALKDVRILIVDDLLVIREMVKEQLRNAGVICESVASGEEALERMRAAAEKGEPFHLAILDYLMPEMNGEMLACAIKDDDSLKDTCLVMLTAAGNPIAGGKFISKGFSAYIPKPVEHLTLVKSIAHVWSQYKGGKTHELISLDTGRNLSTEDVQDDPKAVGVPILVAEDNLVNQVFIREILEEMDAETVIVSNGKEALDIVKNKDFALVIMDCLMPEMDGFEATRILKAMMQNGDIPHTPILALTANAMSGDREKCMEAGMDDYLAKPVRKKELKHRVLAHIDDAHLAKGSKRARRGMLDVNNTEDSDAKTEDGFDGALLDTEMVKNARDILKDKYDEMLVVYFKNSWDRVDEILKALNASNIEDAIRPAHTLKSTSKQMGAITLSSTMKDIEYIAKDMHAAGSKNPDKIQDLIVAMDEVKTLLAETKKAFDKIAA